MTRRTQVLLCLLVLAVCAGPLRLMQRESPQPADSAISPDDVSLHPGVASDAPHAQARALQQTVPITGFTRNRATLEALANAGNSEAAQRLGDVLLNCAPRLDASAAAASYGPWSGVTHRVRWHASISVPLMLTPLPSENVFKLGSPPSEAHLMPAGVDRVALCHGVEHYDGSDRAAAYQWLVLAADLGSPRAMAMRFDIELDRIGSEPAARIDAADELAALRPLATSMLQRAAATGEPRALARLALAHARGDLAPKDAVLARAHEFAADEMFAREGVAGTQSRERLRGSADAEQQAQVEQAAQAILARCCASETP